MATVMLEAIIPAILQVPNRHRGLVLNVLQRLGGDDAEFWRPHIAKVLRQKPHQVTGHKFLKPMEQEFVVFDPECYRTDKSIGFSAEFDMNILSVGQVFHPTDDLSQPSGFDLVDCATDKEVQSELPKDHIFGTDEFLWRAKQMMDMQSNDVHGALFANDNVNNFYVIGAGDAVFAVDVCWYEEDEDSQWYFRCYPCDAIKRGQGSRVFSRN